MTITASIPSVYQTTESEKIAYEKWVDNFLEFARAAIVIDTSWQFIYLAFELFAEVNISTVTYVNIAF